MNFDLPPIDELVATAIAEDLGVPAQGLLDGTVGPALFERDVTTFAVVPESASFKGVIVAREHGIVCGLPVARRTWEMLGAAYDATPSAGSVPTEMFPLVAEGSEVVLGTAVAEVEGPARIVLAGERIALNVLMTLSGIATEAHRWQMAAGDSLEVLDTRKTLPGLRALSKYAVRVGGAHNHRQGLHDMVLIKDNHIEHAKGITAAVKAARSARPDFRVEVEADTVAQAEEAVRAGADSVLLDNMVDNKLADAVARVDRIADESGRSVLTEASGKITFDRLRSLRDTGVDRLSTSALTLTRPLDFGLDEVF